MRAVATLYVAYFVTWVSLLIITVGEPLKIGGPAILVIALSLQLVSVMKPDEVRILSRALSEGTIGSTSLIVYGSLAAIVCFFLIYGLILWFSVIEEWYWMQGVLFVIGGLVLAITPAIPIAYLIEKLRKAVHTIDHGTSAVRDSSHLK